MQKDSETAFLKNRKGFIRLAMQTGAAVVPCFAFGQGGTYSWWRPGPPLLSEAFVQAMSRRMGELDLQGFSHTGYTSILLGMNVGTLPLHPYLLAHVYQTCAASDISVMPYCSL